MMLLVTKAMPLFQAKVFYHTAWSGHERESAIMTRSRSCRLSLRLTRNSTITAGMNSNRHPPDSYVVMTCTLPHRAPESVFIRDRVLTPSFSSFGNVLESLWGELPDAHSSTVTDITLTEKSNLLRSLLHVSYAHHNKSHRNSIFTTSGTHVWKPWILQLGYEVQLHSLAFISPIFVKAWSHWTRTQTVLRENWHDPVMKRYAALKLIIVAESATLLSIPI